MKIKLPRKRKKLFIKKHGQNDYSISCIANEVLYEENPTKQMTKFVNNYGKGVNRFKAASYY